jgi:DNA polymerase-3 subunit alpha
VHVTKKGAKMAFVTAEDETGELDIVVFPDLYAVMGSKLKNDEVLFVKGKISFKDSAVTLISESIHDAGEITQLFSAMRLCFKISSNMSNVMNDIIKLSEKYSGDTPVCFYVEDLRRYIAPKTKLSVSVNAEYYEQLTEIIQADKIGLIL